MSVLESKTYDLTEDRGITSYSVTNRVSHYDLLAVGCECGASKDNAEHSVVSKMLTGLVAGAV